MNGFLAALFWTSTVVTPDNSILNGVEKKVTPPYQSLSYNTVEYQKEIVGQEIQYSRHSGLSVGPLKVVASSSLTDDNGLWFGYGFYNEFKLSKEFGFGFSFLPGVYSRGSEVDLGGWLMFRSGIELNYVLNNNMTVTISYDHRSSGDIWAFNPGLETWQIGIRSYI